MASLLDQRDYDEIVLDDVLNRAKVDQATFDSCFDHLDQVLMELWQQAEKEFLAGTMSAFAAEGSWLNGVRASAWAVCRFLQADRRRARILMFKLEVGGEEVRAQRDQLIQLYVEVVHAGRLETDDPEAYPRDIAVGVTSSIWERLNDKVRTDSFDELADDVPDMLYITVLPYQGPEAAERELLRGREDLRRYKSV